MKRRNLFENDTGGGVRNGGAHGVQAKAPSSCM